MCSRVICYLDGVAEILGAFGRVLRQGFWRCLLIGLGLVSGVCSGETIRIATLNLQNYLSMDRVVDGVWRRDYPKDESEKFYIRRAICEIQPDILLLQEIGPAPYLEELRRDLTMDGLDFQSAVHFVADDSVRCLAVLSRFELSDAVGHRDLDFKYFDGRGFVKRGMLELNFEDSNGEEYLLFVVHLKSRWSRDERDPESNLRRLKEAEACRDRIIERTQERGIARYMVAGDFNDHPKSAVMRRFYKRGEIEIGKLLPAEDRWGHVWTHHYRKESSYSRVDGFVVSPELFGVVERGRGHILDWPRGKAGSDHRMVFLDLGLGSD